MVQFVCVWVQLQCAQNINKSKLLYIKAIQWYSSLAYLKWSLWKTVMINDSHFICSFTKYKLGDDEDCTACHSQS